MQKDNMQKDNVQKGDVQKNEITHYLLVSLVVICIFCIGIFSFLIIYINNQNEKTINHVGSIYMESMNERISKHFSTMVDLRMTQLKTLVDTIPVEHDIDSEELREWLTFSAQIRDFESLAYFFDDGSYELIYGEQVEAIDADLFKETLQQGERKISVGIGENGERSAVRSSFSN